MARRKKTGATGDAKAGSQAHSRRRPAGRGTAARTRARKSHQAPNAAVSSDSLQKQADPREWVFGLHAVQSVLDNRPETVETVWLAADSGNPRVQELAARADALGLTCEFKPAASLDKKCQGKHQGVLAAVKPRRFPDESDLAQDVQAWDRPLVLVLDSIEDPRNLGACLRSADAAGVKAVILPRHKSAQVTAVTRKTAAGAADSLNIYQVTNLVRSLEILKNAGIWVAGSDCGDDSQVIYQADLTGAVALVMGNEGKGLRPLVRQHCDFLVHIPMRGRVQSLNVAVATGVCLFEAVRQREFATSRHAD